MLLTYTRFLALSVYAHFALSSPIVDRSTSTPAERLATPIVDRNVDLYDLTNLVPSQRIVLQYGGQKTDPSHLAVQIALNTTQPSVLLENSAYIENVECSTSPDTVHFVVRDALAHQTLLASLTNAANTGLILITNADSCNSPDERGFFVVDSPGDISEGQRGTAFSFPVTRQTIHDVTPTLQIEYASSLHHKQLNKELEHQDSTAVTLSQRCSLQATSQLQKLACNMRGYVNRPSGISQNSASDFDSCVTACQQSSTCMSFTWNAAEKTCWSSTVSINAQQPRMDSSSPLAMSNRDCYKCSGSLMARKASQLPLCRSLPPTGSSPSQTPSVNVTITGSATVGSSPTGLTTGNFTTSGSNSTSPTFTGYSNSTNSTITSMSTGASSPTTSSSLGSAATISSYYSMILKDLKYDTNGAALVTLPSGSKVTVANPTFAPNDTALQSAISASLQSLGVQGPTQAFSALLSAATFSSPVIPTSTISGTDELGGGLMPTFTTPAAATSATAAASSSAAAATAATSAAASSVTTAPAPKLRRRDSFSEMVEMAKRDLADDIFGGIDDVCDALEDAEIPEVDIACAAADLADLGYTLYCLFSGNCDQLTVPLPPPPPMNWTYDSTYSVTWYPPDNMLVWGGGDQVASMYCAQCNFNIETIEFAGVVTIDSQTHQVLAGHTTITEQSIKNAVMGLTTTGADTGSQTFWVEQSYLGTISTPKIFSISPTVQYGFGLQWDVQDAVTEMLTAGAEIAVFDFSMDLDFVQDAVGTVQNAKPSLHTVRPNLKPGDTMEMYMTSAISMDIQSLNTTFQTYSSSSDVVSVAFSSQSWPECGASDGIAKQAYVSVSGSATINGTGSPLFDTISKQIADECGFLGAAPATPVNYSLVDGCDNQGAMWAAFDMTGIGNIPANGWFDAYQYCWQIPLKTPLDSGTIDFIGGYYYNYQNPFTLGWYDGTAEIPATWYFILSQGYIYAPVNGNYTFGFNYLTDYQGFWFGEDAYNNFQGLTAIMQGAPPGQTSYSVNMVEGHYYPYRILTAKGGSTNYGNIFNFQVIWPNGTLWMDRNTGHQSEYLVQNSCDGTTAPPFPAWADF